VGAYLSNDYSLRDLCNDLEDLILQHCPRDEELKRLAERCDLAPPIAEQTSDLIHNIVQEAYRDAKVRNSLLKQTPLVFPKLVGFNELNEKFRAAAEQNSAGASTPGTQIRASDGWHDEAVQDVVARVRSVSALRSKFRDVLLGEEQLDRLHAPDLREQLLTALNGITDGRNILMSRSGDLPVQVRRLLSALGRIEDDVESCLEALIYFSQVSRSAEEASRATPSVGITDADRATAELIRLRELNHCREQVLYRLRRLSEDCDRIRADLSVRES
jgi:hypothetical protein